MRPIADPLKRLGVGCHLFDGLAGQHGFIFFYHGGLGGVFIPVFDQQPGIFSPAFCADQRKFAFELFSVHSELEGARFQFFEEDAILGFFCTVVGFQGFVGAGVPDDDRAGAVVAFGDDAFEILIVKGMVFYHHGQSFVRGVQGRAFWDGPAFQHAFHFQPEVIMQAGGVMFLYDEQQGF